MKVFSVFVVALLPIVFSCNDHNCDLTETQCFEVSFVTGICGHAVLKIEDPEFFDLGETWNEQENVFYTYFQCAANGVGFNQSQLSQNRFFVRIRQNPPSPNPDCVMCAAALDYQGTKKYIVDIVANCNSQSRE